MLFARAQLIRLGISIAVGLGSLPLGLPSWVSVVIAFLFYIAVALIFGIVAYYRKPQYAGPAGNAGPGHLVNAPAYPPPAFVPEQQYTPGPYGDPYSSDEPADYDPNAHGGGSDEEPYPQDPYAGVPVPGPYGPSPSPGVGGRPGYGGRPPYPPPGRPAGPPMPPPPRQGPPVPPPWPPPPPRMPPPRQGPPVPPPWPPQR